MALKEDDISCSGKLAVRGGYLKTQQLKLGLPVSIAPILVVRRDKSYFNISNNLLRTIPLIKQTKMLE